MTDLSWLPSAIMQTTGALLGIHVVIYIFLHTTIGNRLTQVGIFALLRELQVSGQDTKLTELKDRLKVQDKQANSMKKPVNITIRLGCLTILTNAVWLDSFTTHILSPLIDPFSVPGVGGIISLSLFIFFLSLVGYQSLRMISIVTTATEAEEEA